MTQHFDLKLEGDFFLLAEEVNEFPDIYIILKRILLKINPNSSFSEISIKDISKETKNIITIRPRSFPEELGMNNILIITDVDNYWGRINFFKEYFKEEKEFKFNMESFRRMIFNRDGYLEMESIDRVLSFLPFLIRRNRFFVRIILKDASFYKKFRSFKYCSNYYWRPKLFNDKFKKVSEGLGDERSKNTYANVVYGKAEKNWKSYFDDAHKKLQYSDYIKIFEEDGIINCGVESGVELQLFSLYNPKTIYNIDPCGSDQLSPLIKSVVKNTDVDNIFIKKALYTTDNVTEEFKPFESTTLLEVIEDYGIDKINLIKSDIEGAERSMVKDLVQISEKLRPQLAISIYHSNDSKGKFWLDDYVDIPLKLMDLLIDYKFYIDHYCYERWELILYCIPSEMDCNS